MQVTLYDKRGTTNWSFLHTELINPSVCFKHSLHVLKRFYYHIKALTLARH
ncbi:hypothetical protein C427_2796 [Paraglaciecola psychrophila 170]|uniref:Uncharacterized protein n=1 Tax=Paraglaciecola psychrophila 170 TaxID=1129794 RepID=M4RMP1_9ALTE|nr:hypothetical protein C427_2796 [Paraglaciecola psychrophila 170]